MPIVLFALILVFAVPIAMLALVYWVCVMAVFLVSEAVKAVRRRRARRTSGR